MLALFLDFDGTLAPLKADPREAVMNRMARHALARLAVNPRVCAFVISGRRLEDLRERVGQWPGLHYLGVHGGDAPGVVLSKPALEGLALARRELVKRLNGASGVVVEDKGVAFAVHHRAAKPAEVVRARELLDQVLDTRHSVLRMMEGDRVWEVLPREIRGKGDAARRQWRLHCPGSLPLYIGNDDTDESAFAALSEGVTARVGPARSTHAHYSLRDPAEVARFLEQLEEEIRWTLCPVSNS